MTTVLWVVEVPGTPVPQGSKRAYGSVVVDTNAAKLKPWRAHVAAIVDAHVPVDWDGLVGPIVVHLQFALPRPKKHYRANGDLKPSAPDLHPTRPDLDKLTRAVLDACTDAGAWRDDSQVAALTASKHYGHRPGVHIEIGKAWQ